MYNQTHRGTWSICLWIWIFIIKHFYFEVENFLKHKSSKQGHLANHFPFDKSYWVVVEVWSNWKHFTLLIIPPRASSPGPIPTTPSCHCTRSALTENGDVGTGAQVIAGQAWGALTLTLGLSSIPESWCTGIHSQEEPLLIHSSLWREGDSSCWSLRSYVTSKKPFSLSEPQFLSV